METTTYRPGDLVETLSGRVGTYVETTHTGHIRVRHDNGHRTYNPIVVFPYEAEEGDQ